MSSQEKSALQELIHYSRTEESIAKQKARMNWIKEGDQNTRFFLQSVKARINQNKILSLEKDGSILHEVNQIPHEAASYFQNLFIEPGSNPSMEDVSFIHKCISQTQTVFLTSNIMPEEIKATIFRMNADKAPRPNDFNARFFQKLWHIVGADVTYAVISFFESGKLLKELSHFNFTSIQGSKPHYNE